VCFWLVLFLLLALRLGVLSDSGRENRFWGVTLRGKDAKKMGDGGFRGRWFVRGELDGGCSGYPGGL
jgi:hypothetical protein